MYTRDNYISAKEEIERRKRAEQEVDQYKGDVRRAKERRKKSHHTE